MELHSKNRFKKTAITDIAINKVQRVKYKGLTDEQNEMLYRFAKLVLLKAQQENNSNESTITIDLDNLDGRIGEINGSEHIIDVDADPNSYHLLRTGDNVAIIHNHPSTQTLSMEDVYFFLHFDTLRYTIVVSNQGTIHYLMKDKNFDLRQTIVLCQECTEDLTDSSPAKEYYAASLDFLTHCSEVGLYYG